MATQNLKSLSKKNWTIDTFTNQDIQISCMMRMADATELMASNYLRLQEENESLRKNKDYWLGISEQRNRTISNLRGQITKLKNKFYK